MARDGLVAVAEAQNAIKKKTVVSRSWILLDSIGEETILDADKYEIMHRVQINARDLRILDPLLSYPSTILGREGAIVLNLEHIKAIITAEEVLLRDPYEDNVIPIVEELRRRLPRSNTVKQEHGEGKENTSGQHDVEGAEEDESPFEFRALEVALEAICSFLDARTTELETDAYPALDELTSKISSRNLDRVRKLKSAMTRLTARVQKVRDELEQLLDDDDDMADLYLTRKLTGASSPVSGSGAPNWFPASPTIGSKISRASRASAATFHGNENDVEELEMLLEAYFMQIDGTLNKLNTISGTPTIVKRALHDISTRLHQHPRKENPPIDDLIYASTQALFQPGASMPPPPPEAPIWSHQQRDTYATPRPSWFGGYRNETSGYIPSGYNSSHFGNDTNAPEEFSMRILCPTGKIGGVIGKAGANVRQLEHNTLARIQVEDTPPEAEERIINVSSQEGPWDRISPTTEAILLLQSRTSAASEDGTVTTRLLVPSSKVGCLLGQGGNIISEMRRRTRADIRVYSKEEKPSYTSANEELVQISGNQGVAREALLEIASRLRMRTFRGGNSTVNPAPMFPEHGFTPSERIPGRGLPSSHMTGAARSPPPVYPVHGFAPPENISSRGPPSSSMSRAGNTFVNEFPKGPRPAYEAQGYPPGPPPASTWYTNMTSAMEIKIPISAVPSVLGVGGSNIADIRQISGAKVKLHDPVPGSSECVVEIHGSSEQLKAAQSLLQAMVASGGHHVPQPLAQPRMQAPLYRQY